MYLIGGIASGYGGYLLNVCYQPGKDINYFLNRLDQVMAAPFANYWNETSLKAIILGIFVYVIGMVMYVTSRKNYMPGQEFGTAVFADPKKVAKQFADKDEHNNLILSQNVRLSMNTRKTRRNLNVLVIGGSGAGKTLFMVKPNLLQLSRASQIITDPKGEILRCCGGMLKAHGYRIRVLNLVEMEQSNGYNPFRYIRSETDIVKLVTNLINNTTPKNAQPSDPFWEKAESLYLQAIFLYVWQECEMEKRNFRMVLQLLNEAEVHADGSPSDLDRRFRRLERKKGSNHPALIQYTAVMDALKKAGSVRAASDAVLTGYEKPADQSETVKKKRAEYGEGYYKKYAAGNGTKYYRVRKSWTDAASQLGAFTSLENAKSACKAGYTVYDDNGKAVYTAAGQQASAGVPFSVQVDILDLNIRTGAGTNYAKTGETTGKGVFTIVEVKAGQGASVGWGRLKSGAGWISLDYATRLA